MEADERELMKSELATDLREGEALIEVRDLKLGMTVTTYAHSRYRKAKIVKLEIVEDAKVIAYMRCNQDDPEMEPRETYPMDLDEWWSHYPNG